MTKKQKVLFSLVVSIILIILLYHAMSINLFLAQPYVDNITPLPITKNQISYNGETGVYTIHTSKDSFRILQLTDIHLGGSFLSVSEDLMALDACHTLIEYTKPDLVIVTGDLVFPMGIMSYSFNNKAPIIEFANFMRNTGVPWAFTYGNHDTEKLATLDKDELDSLMKTLAQNSSGNLLYPYIQPDIYGRSNQMIEIRDDKNSLIQALFLIDSNDYLEDSHKLNEYDFIHDDQVEWYKNNILTLSRQEGHTISSMAFFHIPLREYIEAYDLFVQGSEKVKYFYGSIGETMINNICASQYQSKFFDTAVSLNSTKAMFCGHDHYNNISLLYKGIRLTYGYSIDYLTMPHIAEHTQQRGGTLISIEKNGSFQITPYKLVDLQDADGR